MAELKTLEFPVRGMDCAECTQHVQHAIAALPGVESVTVLLAVERATVRLDPARVDLPMIRQAVAGAGYQVPEAVEAAAPPARTLQDVTRPVLTVFGIVFGAVLFVAVFGEWLGWFEKATARVPFAAGAALVLLVRAGTSIRTVLSGIARLAGQADNGAFSCLVRSAAIVLLTDYTRTLCEEAGAESLGWCVGLAGRCLVLAAAWPLLEEILQTIGSIAR